MQYNKANDPAWYVTTDNAIFNDGTLTSPGWRCYVYDQNYNNDAFESYSVSSGAVPCQ